MLGDAVSHEEKDQATKDEPAAPEDFPGLWID